MDTAEIFFLLGGLSLIGFVLWFFFGQREEAPKVSHGVVIYACPMHPWITSNDPTATCSICGMKLTQKD